jgi:hypothetical protein
LDGAGCAMTPMFSLMKLNDSCLQYASAEWIYEADRAQYNIGSLSCVDGGKYKSAMLAIGGNKKENSEGKVIM